ncbi:sigma-70 family RNA polymerase sigma factor [Actinomadura sp. WAC 06369]|uniref:sigma-70 family RNA polymerase sigma factor n=1 Tax=Actinomadura sp. WAC 06369 TaxID=2203193 RepID=UPI001F3AF409|nr:sigma-70 family RNA polymerase sigma factor [Actinomadura sp. WAC 06369]
MHQEKPEAGDAALISRVRAGDTDAYGTLCERHVPAARGLARHLADGDTAEDAVQEALARILDLMRRGGGPDSGFRPYLLTAVRRAVYDRYRADRRVDPTDRIDDLDRGTPFEDPALRDLERSMVLGAFQSLPERWQTVLWHTEIEGARPAEVAPLLGLTANGAAALAYRAREGLRQAYLQMHLAALPAERGACREAVGKLGAYVRDGLARRDTRRVRGHLDGCAGCTAVHAELAELNGALREVLGPLVLGGAATAYLAAGGGLFGWLFGWLGPLPPPSRSPSRSRSPRRRSSRPTWMARSTSMSTSMSRAARSSGRGCTSARRSRWTSRCARPRRAASGWASGSARRRGSARRSTSKLTCRPHLPDPGCAGAAVRA